MLSSGNCRITYILCTKNKLQQLQCTVPDLIAGCHPDDEIIVFDGQSTDGSHEYLNGLFEAGKFSLYRSEPDRNQAHALNKAMFCARGEMVKVVLDDDVLDYDFMQKCYAFFTQNPGIDVLGANIGLAGEEQKFSVTLDLMKQRNYQRWKDEDGEPFWFQDQSFTFRRSSLPLVGLWHTGINCIDVEITLRLTSLRQIRLAWYTGAAAVRITNPDSVSLNPLYNSKVPADVRRLHAFYGVECPVEWKIEKSFTEKIRHAVRLRTRLRLLRAGFTNHGKIDSPTEAGEPKSFAETYEKCKRWLADTNAGKDFEFLS